MMVIVVTAVNEADPALCEEAWNAIMPFAGDLTKDCVTVSHMFNLAMKSGRQEYMTWVIDNVKWESVRHSPGYPIFFAKALRSLNLLKWPRLTQKFIERAQLGMET